VLSLATAAAPVVLTVDWATPDPSVAARASLSEWAEARGVRLADPRTTPHAARAPDLAIGDAVEEELERSRDAITAHDARAADAALAKAEAALHAHPELPQAAWLLAEVLRAETLRSRMLTPRDPAAAARTWARAVALDGGRATGLGESPDADAPVAPAEGSEVTVDLPMGDPMDVRLDGVLVDARGARAAPGEHQVTVSRRRDGELAWAGWVTVEHGTPARVVLPHASPCSAEDVGSARVADGVVEATSVACPDWVFVRERLDGPAGDLTIATCAGAACGTLLDWRVAAVGPLLPERRTHGKGWPTWATWTLVGAGAAAVTVGSLAAAGVFRPTHDEPVFTTGGLHVSSLPGGELHAP
jgi:hypothetical protein